jgi:outer membrane receptor protein involved in Fe transport
MKRRALSRPFVLPAVLLAVLAVPAWAQRITGDISGTVTDANGAVVPGAAVNAECTTTGLTRNAVSDAEGGYRLADLPICVYKVTVTLQGFKTTTRNVQVAVNTLTKADFALQIGSLAETVEVAAVAPIVEFSDELNNYLDADRINNLPLNGRDFNALLSVVPGVQRAPGGGFLGVNISGQRNTENNFMVDGISNNDRYYGGIAMGESGIVGLPATIVPADAIAEFTVQQTPSAEFGVKGGAAINIVMKSGTNELRGSAHYFHHEDWMDSKNYFTEKGGGDKTPLKNQQFGGTLGGPIVRDRTFFFGYYEGQRINVGTPYRAFVPTPAQIQEARGRIAAAGLSVNPAGAALLSFYPTDPSGEIAVSAPMESQSDSFSLKLDHRLTANNQIAVRGMYGRSHQSAPAFSGTVVAPDKPQDLFNSVTDPRVALVGLTWTSTLAANKIWETRIGYNYFSQTIDINNKIDPKSLGIDTGPLDPQDFGVPAVYYLSSFGYIGGVGGYPITTAPNANTDVSSTFTWINGSHTLKLGGNYQHATTYSVRNRARTVFDFSGGTGDPVDSLVGILLGRADDAARSFGSTVRHLTQDSFGLYINDDWKLSPRFTLSLGLRYDLSKPLDERDDLAANFFPDRGLVQLGQGIDSLYETDKNNFGPRLGFAWDLTGDGRTALRGGYALTYDVGNFAAIHAPYAIAGARTGAFTNPILDVFSVRLDAGFGAAIDDPGATCVDPNTLEGDWVCIRPGVPVFGSSPTGQPPFNAFAVDPNLKTPTYHLFHVSFQRELFKNNAVTLSYVGSRGRDLIMVRDINAPPIGTDFTDPQPFRPFASRYPDLRHIVQLVNDAQSQYDSLQFSWRQADWKGINTQYNLTWSKCTDYNSVNRGGAGQAGQNQNPYDPAAGEGPCDHDRPLNFNVGGNYKIPAISGLGRMGEGWQFSTIFSAMSGRPWTAHVNRDRSGQDFDRTRADCNGEIQYNPRDPDNYIANPEVFSVPANGAIGTCGRNTIRGPGFAQWDLALVKNTRLAGRAELEFRVEVFNLLNRGNFGFLNTNVRSGAFGTASSTPDVDQLNPVVTSGGPRAGQFALKVRF